MSIVHERRSTDVVRDRDGDVEHGISEALDLGVSKLVDDKEASHERWKGKQREDDGPAISAAVEAERASLGRFAHRFFSEEMAACRAAYFRIVLRATILIIILTWACLPMHYGRDADWFFKYWASLASSGQRTGKLTAWLVNRDQARIGSTLENTIRAAPTSGPGVLGWHIIDPQDASDDEVVMQAVLDETAWLAVVVAEGATARLANARATGDTSYDPASAITLYYAQARNEVATANFVLPLATALLSNFTASYATASAQRFLATIVAADGSINTTALNGIATAPQTISPALAWRTVNLRPYTAPVAQAVTLVGQIYLCIFAFILVMAHSTARALVEPHLTFPSYLALRIGAPLALYFPLSLSYAMVSLPFKLPFGARYSYGAGFFVFVAYIYLGMCALGLALEAMVTVLTPRFVPFFLVLLIIVNISTAALPPELQPPLFAYSAGFPFWNIEQAVRTLIFNTASHLPTNAAVLVAWILLSCVSLAVFAWFARRRDIRRLRVQVRRTASGTSRAGQARGNSCSLGRRPGATSMDGWVEEKEAEKESGGAVRASGTDVCVLKP